MHLATTPQAAILVVDDSPRNRALAIARLRAAGYRVSEAASGEEALLRFADDGPALVLLDVNMPGLDGFETLARLRELPGGSDVAVIFLTALDDEETHARALNAGVDDFLTKPIRATELLIRVRSLLRIAQTMRALKASHALVSEQRDALVRARDLRERLSAFIVHDLKNPIAMVSAAAGLLGRKISDDRAASTLRLIERSCDDMNRMVLNLLDVARLEDGQLSPERSSFDLQQLLEDVVTRARAMRAESDREIHVETRYRLNDKVICADAELLRRVVENLLDNAFRHSPRRACVQVSAERRDGMLEIVVSDQGPGIPEQHREHVFDMYARLHDARSDRMGRGLGLVFCRAAVEAHGGKMWVDDAAGGRGAAFHLQLSASPEDGQVR